MIRPPRFIRSRTALAIVAASLIAFGLGACDLSAGGDGVSARERQALNELRHVPRKLLRIDEFAGTYAGVGLGDSTSEVMEVFGPAPKLGSSDVGPLDASAVGTGPNYNCGGRGRDNDFLRYRGVSFWVNRGAVCDVWIKATEVETTRGIAVGDSIAAVEQAYPELACRIAERSEYSVAWTPPTLSAQAA